MVSRILSLVVAAAICAAMIMEEGRLNGNVMKGAFVLLFPLGLIWFSEALGEFTGNIGRGGIVDVRSPSWMIAGIGWLILVGIPLLAFFAGRP